MKIKLLSLLLILVLLVGCGKEVEQTEDTKAEDTKAEEVAKVSDDLIVYSSHPLEFLQPIIDEFEASTGISVEIVAAGTGELLKRVEAESANPLGDVMWGGSVEALSGMGDVLADFKSENDSDVFPAYKNTNGFVTRFTVLPMVLMVNDNLIGDIKIEGYEDLLNPELKGKIANADPSKSSSSLTQLYSQLYAMGDGNPEAGWGYVEKLIENFDGKLLGGSSSVYKGVADGEYTVGITFEQSVMNYIKDGAPVSVVYPKEGLAVSPDGVAIIKGAKNQDNAETFINFVTNKDIQTLIATDLNRRSTRMDVTVEGMVGLDEMKVLDIPLEWSLENKVASLDRYKEIFIK